MQMHTILHTRSFKAGLAIEVEQISLHTPPTQKHTEIDEGEVGEKHLVWEQKIWCWEEKRSRKAREIVRERR
jgi:hypothetical protein